MTERKELAHPAAINVDAAETSEGLGADSVGRDRCCERIVPMVHLGCMRQQPFELPANVAFGSKD